MQVPFTTAPSVEPSISQPSGEQSIQTPTAAFGGSIGAAASQTGGQFEQAGNTVFAAALQRQQTTNELMANDGSTQLIKQQSAAWGSFSQLKGKDAQAGLPAYQAQLQDNFDGALKSMPNPAVAGMLDKGTRQLHNNFISMGQAHADQELNRWSTQSSTDRAAEFTNQAAIQVNNPTQMDTLIQGGANEIRALATHNGITGDDANSLVAKQIGGSVQKITETLIASGDPNRAAQILDQYQDKMDAGSRLAVATKLKPAMIDYTARTTGDKLIQSVMYPPAEGSVTAASVDDVTNAIHGQESRGAATSVTSVDGARGGFQIVPATFQQYAKPGENIDNPADNAAVGKRIIADIYNKAGGDPARTAVGYFSGPGNIAPPGATTPWINDRTDGNNKSVSGYVSDVMSRLPAGVDRGNMKMDKGAVLASIDASTAGDPAQNAATRKYVTQKFADIDTAALGQQLQVKAASDKAENGYISQILQGQTDGITTKIAQDPNLSPESRKSVGLMAEEHIRQALSSGTKGYGPGFDKLYQQINAAPDDPNRLTDLSQLYKYAAPQPAAPPNFSTTSAPGMVAPSTISGSAIWNRPSMQNPDGSYSTTSSIGVTTDQGEAVIPTVVDGKRLSNADAIAHFKQTGEHFGIFKDEDSAETYSQKLHDAQATMYDDHGKPIMTPPQLTVSGIDKLRSEAAGRQTPEGEAAAEMKKSFLGMAKAKITGTDDQLGMKDPRGDELYLKFMAHALPAYDAGLKGGKTPTQMLDPDSKDYIGAAISQFARTPKQRMADMKASALEGSGVTADPASAPDISTPAGLKAAVASGQMTRQAGILEAQRRGYIAAAPPPAAPAPAPPMIQ